MDSENPDLTWDLEGFGDHVHASEFVKTFEHMLCVYSGTVEQLYSKYDIYYPKEEGRKLVILPDLTAFHEIFFNIRPDSVLATGLYVIPGTLLNREGLFLTNLLKNRAMGPRQVPFEAGMRRIMKKRPAHDPFLPVVANGDLRELDDKWPVIHLHRIKTSTLEIRSALERKDIQDIITEKLEQLFDASRC